MQRPMNPDEITEKSNYENTLQKSLKRYETLVNSIDGIVWEADVNINFTFVSKKAERLLGYSLNEWYQPNFWADHLHPEDKVRVVKFCKDQCDLLLPHDFEYRFLASDGRTVWLRDIVSIVTDNGNLMGLRGVMFDVSDYKNTTEELEKSLSLLAATLESTADGILVVDRSGKIIVSNKKFQELWNIPVEVMHSKDDAKAIESILDQLIFPNQFLVKIKELYEHPDWESMDEIEFKDGKVLSRYSKPQFINGNIVGRVWSFRNITVQRQYEKNKEEMLQHEKEARLEAEKSVRLRDDFLSIASHELKTPLTPIRMQIGLVKRNLKEIGGTHPKTAIFFKVLEDADKQFDRFLKLVEDLLDVSRITAGRLIIEKEETNLSDLLQQKIEDYMPEFNLAKCEVTKKIEPNVVGYWDQMRIEQVLNNLFSNAKKYGSGKPVEIILSSLKNKDNVSTAQLIIRDHGIGIAKENIPKLFGRFERVAPVSEFGGLGLGLYITNAIILAHGGSIKVESALNVGSSFIVELPLSH